MNFEDMSIPLLSPQACQMKSSLVFTQRKIFVTDDITSESVMENIFYLYKLMEIDNIFGEKKPITIYVNSGGGQVQATLSLIALIESMKESGYEIITINMGEAFSAAMAIAICGTKRMSYRYAKYMVHDASTMFGGKVENIREMMEQAEELRGIYYDLICKYSNITLEQLEEWQKNKSDKFFSVEELMELKGVDGIL